MNYERFSQLWDALVTNRPSPAGAVQITNGMSENTAAALIEYAEGDRSKIDSIRGSLGIPAVAQ